MFSSVANAKSTSTSPAELTTQLLALLQRLSSRPGKNDVHDVRTTERRLEVQLRNPPPKVAKALKQLRKRAGKARDLDVHLGLLKAPLLPRARRRSDAQQAADAQDELRKFLKRKRNRQRDALRDMVKETAPLLKARLPEVAEGHAAPTVSLHDARQRASRARHRYLQYTRQIPDDEQRLHVLRINVKKLRYEMEPLVDCEEATELVEKFKQVQDAIGDWHDWLTLAELAVRHFDSPKGFSGAGLACKALRARAAREYRKARRSAESVSSWMMGRRPAAPAAAADTGPRLLRKAG